MKTTVAAALAAFFALGAKGAEMSGESGNWSRIYLGSNPSVSGDGRSFAFEWNDNIWFASTRGGYARRLGTGASSDTWPVMSPDGSKVAFASDRDGGMKVFEFKFATGSIRQVTYHSESTMPRSWCPGSDKLLCVGYRDDSGPKTCIRILVIDTEVRSAEKTLFDLAANDPVMSPDGAYVLFTRRGDELYRKRRHSSSPAAGQIWRYEIATGSFDLMVANESDCRSPQWMPDGSGFYYLDARGGVRNVWRHDIASGEDTQLTFFYDDHVFQPSLSADGKTMVFRQKFDFWRFDPTTPEVAPEKIDLMPEPGYVARSNLKRRRYEICWNNDTDGDVTFCDNGSQVAFTTGGDLYVMDTIIREPTLIHGDTLTHERECAFSPDGKALYYLSDRGDTCNLIKAEPEDPSKPWWENSSFRKTVISDEAGQRMGLTVSPDGSRLAWHDPSGVYTFSTTDGVKLSRGPAATSAGGYSWSPDGRWVVAQLSDEFANSDVWILSTDGTSEPYNLSRNFKYDGEPTWSPDGKMIAFVSERPEIGNGKYLRYVYLDPTVEELETYAYELDRARRTIRDNATDSERYAALDIPGERLAAETRPLIDFTDLADRVRTVKCFARLPFFRWDSRTIAYMNEGGQTDIVHVPDKLSGERLYGCSGVPREWIERGDRVLWIVDRLPAIGETKLAFKVYQNTYYADYQELAFRTAWARIRDLYYDPNTHGANWKQVGDEFLDPARNATSYSVFIRVMNMVLGELDSSHLGFYADENSTKEWAKKSSSGGWSEQTAHLGVRFERENAPDGWIVRDVIPGGPADRHGYGVRPGDVVTAIDGISVAGGIDPTVVLNGPPGRKVRVTYRNADSSFSGTIVLESCSYADARAKLAVEEVKSKRRIVHERSGGHFGYLNIDAMNQESLWLFQHEVFSEGYGRDGLVIDVRNNYGGFTADHMLQILMGADHSRSVTRNCGSGYLFGYWGRPVWSKPIVVLCNEATGSNGEIFSHAIKTLKRGKLVGRETGGGVIGTYDAALLDLGSFRDARFGWFILDGTDMEHNGAKPDFEVEDLPSELAAGIDSQLDKAIEVLGEEVEAWRAANPPIEFKFAR